MGTPVAGVCSKGATSSFDGVTVGLGSVMRCEEGLTRLTPTSLSKPMIYIGWTEIGYDGCKTEEVSIRTPQLPSQRSKYKNTYNILLQIIIIKV